MELRRIFKEAAIRIDHIGSTSVPGLDAKPVIDVQISVRQLDDAYIDRLEAAGWIYRKDNPDLSKRYFREPLGCPRVHIHVREQGSWSEQLSLLFRDYLRAHSEDCSRYAKHKYELMKLYPSQRTKYIEQKGPPIWEILQRAHVWSQLTGWKPGESDC